MVPKNLRAGDSLSFSEVPKIDNLGRTIDSSWVLKIFLRGPKTLDLTGTTSGTGWTFSITTTQSSGLDAGDYFWQMQASKGDEKVTLDSGKMTILPNLQSQAAGFDGRSQIKKDLDAVQAAMRSIINGGAVQSYTIHNRQIQKMAMADLIALEQKLKRELIKEEKAEMIKNGLGNPHAVFVRFK